MKNRLHILPGAFLVTVLTVGASIAVAAKPTGRMAVAGRHQIRAELIAAMADGKLSERERKSILVKAKQLLTPNDLHSLEFRQTLSRLSARNKTPLPPKTHKDTPNNGEDKPAEAKQPEAKQPDRSDTKRVTQATLMVPDSKKPASGKPASGKSANGKPASGKPAKTVSFDESATLGSKENPFREETPDKGYEEETFTLMDDPTVLFEEGRAVLDDFNAFYAESWRHVAFSTSVDAFKGPLDLDNLNGNFGFQFGVNGGFPVAKQLGIGIQLGTSAVLSDLHGSQFTGSTIRNQSFTTVGLFQRNPLRARRLNWGFAFDWLVDDYYAKLDMTQWRVKLGYELSRCNEIGIWATIPDDGDNARLDHGDEVITNERFKPVAQGVLYQHRYWAGGTTTTAWIGIVEEPGEFVFGADARVPFGSRMSLFGNFNYVLPSSNGTPGRTRRCGTCR